MKKVAKYRKPKFTVIGGGTGLPIILKGLQECGADVSAIVTVADDGGSSGVIRDYVNVVPPGDIRNCLTALSDVPQVYKDIFQYRFDSKDKFFSGHAIGNLIIAALTEMRSNVFDAIEELSEMMQVKGKVLPAAEESLVLHAIFEDGTRASGESTIVTKGKKIQEVYVTTMDDAEPAKASREVIHEIMDADVVVIGPGSLFTSILPNLMIDDLAKALIQTKAEIVYICNIMTQRGETEGFTDADHVRVLHRHLHYPFIDTVLVNTEKVIEPHITGHKAEEYLVQVKHDFQGLRNELVRVISNDFLEITESGVYHDCDKVVTELMNTYSSLKERNKHGRVSLDYL